jgi:hypothetical protein
MNNKSEDKKGKDEKRAKKEVHPNINKKFLKK